MSLPAILACWLGLGCVAGPIIGRAMRICTEADSAPVHPEPEQQRPCVGDPILSGSVAPVGLIHHHHIGGSNRG